jgi:hypothetical protein
MNLGKEAVDEGRLKVVYQSTEEMEADGFCKPYDPAKHIPFARLIQGEDNKVSQQVGAMQNGVENVKEKLNAGAKKGRKLNDKMCDETEVENKE